MCLGIPMRVREIKGVFALCEGRNGNAKINTMLVDNVKVGDWLLTFLDTAREVIDAERARLINTALDGLASATQGEGNLDEFFSDLVNREPQLPEFLRKS